MPLASQPGLPFPRKPYEGQSSAQSSTSNPVSAYAAESSPHGSANPPPSYPVTPGSGSSSSSVVRLVNPLHALSDSLQGLGLRGRDGGGSGGGSGNSGGSSDRPNVFGDYPGRGGSSAFSTVGVAGLVRREEAKTSEAGRSLGQAFQDLSALMKSAQDMVALAERFRGIAAHTSADDSLMDLETQRELIALGIASPVTKESAGARFHIELSRQLSDFLEDPLGRCGGMMTLPDVYCLFNRARGSELVSPDDLLAATKMFEAAGVSLCLRTFASGVRVVQGRQHTDEAVCLSLAKAVAPRPAAAAMIHPVSGDSSVGGSSGVGRAAGSLVAAVALSGLGPGLTAGDVAKLQNVSVTIAAEYLLMAEQRQVLCRDDGPDGLRFFHNFFRQVMPA
ncbi:MAG: hypothetical protein WDW36_001914 [Sanguina aurantia]